MGGNRHDARSGSAEAPVEFEREHEVGKFRLPVGNHWSVASRCLEVVEIEPALLVCDRGNRYHARSFPRVARGNLERWQEQPGQYEMPKHVRAELQFHAKELIDTSVSVSAEGLRLVSLAGGTMAEINDAVARVTSIMSEIGSASDEQRRGISHVAQAVSQMDSVTQQNATLVELAAAAATSMNEQAASLRKAIDVFGVKRSPV